MSCSGCRILRKGCSENCILRQSLVGIESPQAQAHATVFVAKFFGRAGLMSFLSGVPEPQRPELFQSLLYEACGRTVNPVHGAVGLLWTGNWHLCQAAVETVLRGGVLGPTLEFPGEAPYLQEPDYASEATHSGFIQLNDPAVNRRTDHDGCQRLDLLSFPAKLTSVGKVKERAVTPEDSETTTLESWAENNYQRLGREKSIFRRFF